LVLVGEVCVGREGEKKGREGKLE
jgi:hypothetical protein